MSEIIKCNTGKLSSDESTINSELKKIDTCISNLKTLESQLAASWEGDAAKEFKTRILTDIRMLEKLHEEMKTIAAYEDRAITEYNKCEKDISSMITAISL